MTVEAPKARQFLPCLMLNKSLYSINKRVPLDLVFLLPPKSLSVRLRTMITDAAYSRKQLHVRVFIVDHYIWGEIHFEQINFNRSRAPEFPQECYLKGTGLSGTVDARQIQIKSCNTMKKQIISSLVL